MLPQKIFIPYTSLTEGSGSCSASYFPLQTLAFENPFFFVTSSEHPLCGFRHFLWPFPNVVTTLACVLSSLDLSDLRHIVLFQPNNALPPLWKIFLAWLFREFSWIAFFLQAACGREIEWRTSHFVLRLGGKAERLQEKCQDLNNHCCWTEY